jgi:hypothetical protein
MIGQRPARAVGLTIVAASAAVGSAYAATSVSSGSLSACVHHNGGALYEARQCAKHDRRLRWGLTGPQGPQGPQGTQGPTGPQGASGPAGPSGEPATKLFAQVESDGDTAVASRVVQTAKVGLGQYLVDFGQDISRCVALVQEGGIPAGPGGSEGGGGGPAQTHIFGAGATFSNGFATGDTVLVSTIDRSGLADSSFQLAVLC